MFSTLIVYHRYRLNNPSLYKFSNSATITIVQRAVEKFSSPRLAINSSLSNPDLYTVQPYPFLVADETHGFRMKAGEFTFTIRKQFNEGWKQFRYTAKVLPNLSRWLGRIDPVKSNSQKVLIFGDSFVFGEGVNDEQTFSFLLQQKYPHLDIQSFATNGYSLLNTLFSLKKIGSQLSSKDVILIGYADYFDVRHVAAPSRIRAYGEPRSQIQDVSIKLPGAMLNSDSSLRFFKVPIFCKFAGNYCSNPDPSKAYMTSVTQRIIQEIAETTKAKVILLHFWGSRDDKALANIPNNIDLLSATLDDFDYEIRDDILGFDFHPGPFWHYAMFQYISDYFLNQEIANED